MILEATFHLVPLRTDEPMTQKRVRWTDGMASNGSVAELFEFLEPEYYINSTFDPGKEWPVTVCNTRVDWQLAQSGEGHGEQPGVE